MASIADLPEELLALVGSHLPYGSLVAFVFTMCPANRQGQLNFMATILSTRFPTFAKYFHVCAQMCKSLNVDDYTDIRSSEAHNSEHYWRLSYGYSAIARRMFAGMPAISEHDIMQYLGVSDIAIYRSGLFNGIDSIYTPVNPANKVENRSFTDYTMICNLKYITINGIESKILKVINLYNSLEYDGNGDRLNDHIGELTGISLHYNTHGKKILVAIDKHTQNINVAHATSLFAPLCSLDYFQTIMFEDKYMDVGPETGCLSQFGDEWCDRECCSAKFTST